jgi:hypothetical protein
MFFFKFIIVLQFIHVLSVLCFTTLEHILEEQRRQSHPKHKNELSIKITEFLSHMNSIQKTIFGHRWTVTLQYPVLKITGKTHRDAHSIKLMLECMHSPNPFPPYPALPPPTHTHNTKDIETQCK